MGVCPFGTSSVPGKHIAVFIIATNFNFSTIQSIAVLVVAVLNVFLAGFILVGQKIRREVDKRVLI